MVGAGLSQGYAGGNHHRIADLDCVLLTAHIHSQGEHPVGGIHLAGQVGVHAPGDGKLPPGGLILAQSHDGAGRAEAGNDFGGVARPVAARMAEAFRSMAVRQQE